MGKKPNNPNQKNQTHNENQAATPQTNSPLKNVVKWRRAEGGCGVPLGSREGSRSPKRPAGGGKAPAAPLRPARSRRAAPAPPPRVSPQRPRRHFALRAARRPQRALWRRGGAHKRRRRRYRPRVPVCAGICQTDRPAVLARGMLALSAARRLLRPPGDLLPPPGLACMWAAGARGYCAAGAGPPNPVVYLDVGVDNQPLGRVVLEVGAAGSSPGAGARGTVLGELRAVGRPGMAAGERQGQGRPAGEGGGAAVRGDQRRLSGPRGRRSHRRCGRERGPGKGRPSPGCRSRCPAALGAPLPGREGAEVAPAQVRGEQGRRRAGAGHLPAVYRDSARLFLQPVTGAIPAGRVCGARGGCGPRGGCWAVPWQRASADRDFEPWCES